MIQGMKNRLTAEELSLILDISVFTVKALAKSRQIPCEYLNRQPYFKLEELYRFFLSLEEASL